MTGSCQQEINESLQHITGEKNGNHGAAQIELHKVKQDSPIQSIPLKQYQYQYLILFCFAEISCVLPCIEFH